jgi:chaperonin GroEL
MGADLIKEAAGRTNEVAGDGTTTATVLTQAMVNEGIKLTAAGHDPVLLKKGIEEGTKFAIDTLKRNAVQVKSYDDIAHVGTISANGDSQIGRLIAEAMEKVGRDGIITVEDAKGMTTTLDVAEGMQVDRGYISPYFVNNNERMHALYQDAYVLVTDKKISSLAEMMGILEAVHRAQVPLLIVAEDVEGEALHGLVLNRTKSNLKVVAIRAPGYGILKDQLLEDIAVLVGTKVASVQTGVSLEKLTLNDLGRCKKVVVDSKGTTLVGSGKTKKDVEARIQDLRCQIEDVTLDMAGIQHLRTRIARLGSGVAIIRVGGSTELEMIERKYRIEDALNATRAAAEEGIVPGGGTALHAVSKFLTEELKKESWSDRDVAAGVELVRRACQAPLRRIAKNAGVSADVVLEKLSTITDRNVGWNAATNEYVDLVTTGVVDPVKVSRTAIENAASVAITFLTLDAVVFEEK